ncbi:MAG: hypothetical protein EOP53_23540, partial [Sphingobacteriales bacterium]
MKKLFTDEHWEEWKVKESKNYNMIDTADGKKTVYKKKGYLHFDLRFPFLQRHEEIRQIVSSERVIMSWKFYPFLKVVNRTLRFKQDSNKKRPVRSTKDRPICYAAHKDALIYGFYAHGLTKCYEAYIRNAGFADSILAYRTDLDGKCNIQFASEAFHQIKLKGECTVISLDIKSFFDRLDHQILKRNWMKIIGEASLPDDQYKIFKTLTQFGYIKEEELLQYFGVDLNKIGTKPRTLLDLSPEKRSFMLFQKLRDNFILRVNGSDKNLADEPQGIPQGSPMSAVLSNIYMIDFDAHIHRMAKDKGCIYSRYCDDILLVCPMEEATDVRDAICAEIKKCKLEIQAAKEDEIWFRYDNDGILRAFNGKKIKKNPEKFTPEKDHLFYKSLQYLGFEHNGQDIRIRSSSINRFYRKMKRRLSKNVKMAYSPNAIGDKVKTRTTYWRYSHFGKRNFLKYAYRCAEDEFQNAMHKT